jgi:hypothetical protein
MLGESIWDSEVSIRPFLKATIQVVLEKELCNSGVCHMLAGQHRNYRISNIPQRNYNP